MKNLNKTKACGHLLEQLKANIFNGSHHMFVFRQEYVVVDRFYIALFSALEQTHCVRI